METIPPWILLTILAVLLGVPGMISLMLYLQIRALTRPSLRLEPADPERDGPAIAAAQKLDAWMQAEGFELADCCVLNAMQRAFIAAWQHTDRMRYACIYQIGPQQAYDIVTLFASDMALTTGSAVDGLLLPMPPGEYGQAFPKTSLEELWSRHTQSEAYLVQNGAVVLPAGDRPFADVFLPALRRHAAYVRSLPLWPLRGTYWFFVRRNRLKNLSVEQQVERGLVPLPRDVLV